MINTFFLVGEIKKLTVSEPKDPKKNASAVMLVQYGSPREQTGGSVEFVNAVLVRVPSYKFPKLRDQLRTGQIVQITGHLQGVLKSFADQGFLSAELVADRVDIVNGQVSSTQAPADESAAAPAA